MGGHGFPSKVGEAMEVIDATEYLQFNKRINHHAKRNDKIRV